MTPCLIWRKRLLLLLLLPACLALLAAITIPSAWAGGDHDHGGAPAATVTPAKPRFSATSESFELVGVVDGKQLTLYLDHAADNSPVQDAQLALDVGGAKLGAKPLAAGVFEAALATALQPGVTPVTATVVEGTVTDLLAGELDLHDGTLAEAAMPAAPWKAYAPWAAGGLAALVLLVVGRAAAVRRRAARRNTFSGGAV